MAAQAQILVVDDEKKICEFLAVLLGREGYRVAAAHNAADALDCVGREPFDMVITDLKMPGMDGFELVTRLKALKPGLPVVMITGYATVETAVRALRHGVDDYVTKPFNIEELRKVVSRSLQTARIERENRDLIQRLKETNAELARHRLLLAEKVRRTGSALEEARVLIDQYEGQLEEHCLAMIEALVNTLEAKDHYTSGHSRRVSQYACALAQAMGSNPAEIELLRRAACLHDIGKIGVHESILEKPSRLTLEERNMVQEHPSTGEGIVKPLDFLRPLRPLIRHHHERMDGQGYPDHLCGGDIPLLARILTIADSFDAMTSERPYRPAMSRRNAAAELMAHAGRQFDASLAGLFCDKVLAA